MSHLFLTSMFSISVFSVRPPSLADPDLSPAEEEIPAPADDKNSEDESSDDSASVWHRRAANSLWDDAQLSFLHQSNIEEVNHMNTRSKSTVDSDCAALRYSLTFDWSQLPDQIDTSPTQLHYSCNRTINGVMGFNWWWDSLWLIDNQVQL